MTGKGVDMNSENKREFTRTEVKIMAEIVAPDGSSVSGSVRDISMSGIFMISENSLPEETDCKVAVFLDGGEEQLRLEMEGKVTRSCSEGMAIEFNGVEVDSVEHLHNLIKYNTSNTNDVEKEFHDHLGLKRFDGMNQE